MGEPTTIPFEGNHSEDHLDLFGPYRQLHALDIGERRFWVPEDNTVLRALQFVELQTGAIQLPYRDYCWSNTTGCCLMRYREGPGAPERSGRACVVRATPGLCIIRLPKGGKRCG